MFKNLVPKGKACDHIFIVFLESTARLRLGLFRPNPSPTFSSGVLPNNYHGVTHPSQPNYFAAIAGDYFDYRDNNTHAFGYSYKTVVDLLEAEGLTWRTYQENLPSRKYNPSINFDNISKNATRCKNVIPATQLATDLLSGYLPNYSFYTPNIKNDGHDTIVAYASKWLSGFLSALLSIPIFANNTPVVVTFDEADDYTDKTDHVVGLLLGDSVKNIKNIVDSTF
ncbi:hypothetical protein BGX23_007758 [Mortierella sp. AD031]|nr:hypothetical protein BGX23_007758 [Mortierella sp. AD031]